jgi:hypothetical protein
VSRALLNRLRILRIQSMRGSCLCVFCLVFAGNYDGEMPTVIEKE